MAKLAVKNEIRSVVEMAREKGLLSGPRSRIVRARMPEKLVAKAKRRTGITSDSKLMDAALANLAYADDYGMWLLSQARTVNPDLDLEF